MNRYLAGVLSLLVAVALFPSASAADNNPEIAKKIKSLAYEQWDAFNKKDVAKAMEQVAKDYTEFNPVVATRVDGKALNMRLAEADGRGSSEGIAAEMLNPKVQVYGDVAILSYNYMGMSMDKDGKTEPFRAKSTRVYAKMGEEWKLVHANFGADPMPD